ncbi:MAG: dipeptidase PepV [Clostridium butyricum]
MYKKQIEEYFEKNKEQILNDICDQIRIKSDRGEAKENMPYGEGPAKALEAALKLAESMGFKTKNYDNYVGTVDFSDKEKGLDILAHLDVVPAGDEWTVTQPYEPVIKDGKIYGRGSSDDKGPAIVALYALKAVKDMNIPLSKNVRLILGTDEECGSSDIEHYYAVEKEAPMTFSPDAEFPLINIEKGRLAAEFTSEYAEDKALPRVIRVNGGVKANVVPDKASAEVEGFTLDVVSELCKKAEEKTKVRFTVTEDGSVITINAKGKGAHASTPENGDNAITAIIELLTSMPCAKSEGFERLCAVNKLFPHNDHIGAGCGVNMSDELSGSLSMAFTIFEYNTTSLKGTFDSRSPICANDENLTEALRKNMADVKIVLGTEESDKLNQAHHVSSDSDFVRTLLKCYEDYSGQKGECLAIGGGTYVHHLENGVAFGCSMPGTDNNMHGNDEFAVIDELMLSGKIFTQAIIDLCK